MKHLRQGNSTHNLSRILIGERMIIQKNTFASLLTGRQVSAFAGKYKHMKTIVCIILFCSTVFIACEKVIDVDLNEAHPEIVIEANVSKNPLVSRVKISKTASFFGNSSIGKIDGAIVVVENESGKQYIFDEVEKGTYEAPDLIPLENMEYKLRVEVENKSYEANSELPRLVPIDTLKYYFDDGFAFLEEGYVVQTVFTDPADTDNFYRIKVFNGDSIRSEFKDIILFDDRLIEGKQVEISLRGYVFDANDTVSVQLITLDKGAYEYYKTFQELINVNPGTAAPANPTSNLSNGALGYFSAWTSDIKTVVIEGEENGK